MLNRQIDQHKKYVLQVFLLSSVVAATVFAILNFDRGNHLLAVLELFIAIFSFSLFLYIYLKKNDINLHLISMMYVLLFFSVLTYSFSSDLSSDSIFIWALVIPMISYLLLGVKSGFFFTLIFYSAAAWFFFARFNSHDLMSERVSHANVYFLAALFWILSHAYELTNQQAKNQLRQMAVLDHLTGLYNRILLERIYHEKLFESMQQGTQLGLVLFDLDHFKRINDDYGHAVGDQVLIEFSAIVADVFEDVGVSFRIGGEEFLVLMQLTHDAHAYELAELVRKRTEQLEIKKMYNHQVSVSAGVATNNKQEVLVEDLLRVADQRLYRAKQRGRNQVVLNDQVV